MQVLGRNCARAQSARNGHTPALGFLQVIQQQRKAESWLWLPKQRPCASKNASAYAMCGGRMRTSLSFIAASVQVLVLSEKLRHDSFPSSLPRGSTLDHAKLRERNKIAKQTRVVEGRPQEGAQMVPSPHPLRECSDRLTVLYNGPGEDRNVARSQRCIWEGCAAQR